MLMELKTFNIFSGDRAFSAIIFHCLKLLLPDQSKREETVENIDGYFPTD